MVYQAATGFIGKRNRKQRNKFVLEKHEYTSQKPSQKKNQTQRTKKTTDRFQSGERTCILLIVFSIREKEK